MHYRFSRYGQCATVPSPVNRMMAAFAEDFRDDIDINLGVGYVNEKTIPDALLLEAMQEIVTHPEVYRQAFNYGGPQGAPSLIKAIREFYSAKDIGGITPDVLDANEIIIGPSGATSILEALADIFEPGIVVTADPMYYIYCNYLERKGFEVVTVPEDEEGISTDAIEERLTNLKEKTDRLAFFYVVTVNNPSGVILSNARKHALTTLAQRWSKTIGRPVPLFLDQAYEWLIHDPLAEKPQSALMMDNGGLAYEIGTLSKVIAPALRIGFILGPPGPLMRAITQKTSDVGFSAPLTNQEMAAFILKMHMDEQLTRVNAGYREKARRIGAAIQETLGPWLKSMRGGQGGFYYYLTFDTLRTDSASPFFNFLARTTGTPSVDGANEKLPRVIYLPGEFCVHPRGPLAEEGNLQLRLSYGFEDTDTVLKALHLMREAALYSEATAK